MKVLGIPVILILEKSLATASHSRSTAAPQAGSGGCGRCFHFSPVLPPLRGVIFSKILIRDYGQKEPRMWGQARERAPD